MLFRRGEAAEAAVLLATGTLALDEEHEDSLSVRWAQAGTLLNETALFAPGLQTVDRHGARGLHGGGRAARPDGPRARRPPRQRRGAAPLLGASASRGRLAPGQSRSSAMTGTWSDGLSQPRASLNTVTAPRSPARSGLSQTWSSRRPLSAAAQSGER